MHLRSDENNIAQGIRFSKAVFLLFKLVKERMFVSLWQCQNRFDHTTFCSTLPWVTLTYWIKFQIFVFEFTDLSSRAPILRLCPYLPCDPATLDYVEFPKSVLFLLLLLYSCPSFYFTFLKSFHSLNVLTIDCQCHGAFPHCSSQKCFVNFLNPSTAPVMPVLASGFLLCKLII